MADNAREPLPPARYLGIVNIQPLVPIAEAVGDPYSHAAIREIAAAQRLPVALLHRVLRTKYSSSIIRIVNPNGRRDMSLGGRLTRNSGPVNPRVEFAPGYLPT